MSAKSLDIIAAPSPDVPESAVAALLLQEYGLSGSLEPLISERDQNFRLKTTDGKALVVKIANAAEPGEITEFQIEALLYLENRGCPVPVPVVIRTQAGEVSTTIRTSESSHILRLVSYVAGHPVEGMVPGPELAFELGRSLALLDEALRDFSHPGESQVLLWDMQRAGELRDLIIHIQEPGLQDLAHACLDEFESRAEPAFPALRAQVIHNDLNPGNVLVDDARPPAVSGVIDFGDMIRAPLVVDVAIAASYLRSMDEDLAATRAMITGFASVTPLEHQEQALLFDLIRMRLATTITIMHWRQSARSSEDPYLQKAFAERRSERFLRHISKLGRKHFSDRVFQPKN